MSDLPPSAAPYPDTNPRSAHNQRLGTLPAPEPTMRTAQSPIVTKALDLFQEAYSFRLRTSCTRLDLLMALDRCLIEMPLKDRTAYYAAIRELSK